MGTPSSASSSPSIAAEVAAGRELEVEPRVTLRLGAVDFLRLATGNADPATLYLSGRLELSGDELFAIEMASFLRIPGAEGETSGERALDPGAVDASRIAAVVRDAPDRRSSAVCVVRSAT